RFNKMVKGKLYKNLKKYNKRKKVLVVKRREEKMEVENNVEEEVEDNVEEEVEDNVCTIDGHERDDAVAYWKKFLEEIKNLESRIASLSKCMVLTYMFIDSYLSKYKIFLYVLDYALRES
ncbi:742_t:CDS:2, partial [Racocetra persica]